MIKICTKNLLKYKLAILSSTLVLSSTSCNNINSNSIREGYDISISDEETTFHSELDGYDNEDIYNLPSNLKYLYLGFNFYLTDLSMLPEQCPNLEVLSIVNTPGISDLEFIKKLPNLKYIYLDGNPYLTEDIINYLNSHDIVSDVSMEDVKYNIITNEIVNSIITDNMTDEEKIKAVTLYIINNFAFDETLTPESNASPLKTFINKQKGVCISYAYLSTVLLNKAGVEAYNMVNSDHAWTLVKCDNKYYYIDTTNMEMFAAIGEAILDKFNIGIFYMSDPGFTPFTAMSDYDSDQVIISDNIFEEIKNSEDSKNIYEKYRGSLPAWFINICFISGGIGATLGKLSNKLSKKSIKK